MLTKPKAKKLVDGWIIKELDRLLKVITIFDCGPTAKQKDVTKVKDEIRKRLAKLNGRDEMPMEGVPDDPQE